VAQQLIDLGFKHVWALKGGWNQWDQAGYPSASRSLPKICSGV